MASPWSRTLPRWSSCAERETGTAPWSEWCCGHKHHLCVTTAGHSDVCRRCRAGVQCLLLAGEEPHHVPVAGENAELHQVSEDTQNLQQELLKVEMKRRWGWVWQNRAVVLNDTKTGMKAFPPAELCGITSSLKSLVNFYITPRWDDAIKKKPDSPIISDVYLGEGKLKKTLQDGSNKIQPENLSEPAALEDELKKGLKDLKQTYTSGSLLCSSQLKIWLVLSYKNLFCRETNSTSKLGFFCCSDAFPSPLFPLCSESSPSAAGSGCRSSVGGGTAGRTHTLPANRKTGRKAGEPITRRTQK